MTRSTLSALKPSNSTPTENSSPTLPDSVRTLGGLSRYARRTPDDATLVSPGADVRALLTAAVNAGLAGIIFRGDEPHIDEAGRKHLVEMLVRRVARELLQYILGTTPMMSLELQVGPSVFVPRPETELLAWWAIDRARELVASGVVKPKIVDLCTGSGASALAVADAVSEVDVVAVGLSERAWAWAAKNIEAYGDGRVRLIVGDVMDDQLTDDSGELADWVGETDIVVSNPPHAPEDTEITPEVRADPHSTVFGDDDGLDVIQPMMNLMDALVRSGGVIGIEYDDSSGDDINSLLKDTRDYADVEVRRDFAGRDRFTVGRKNRS